jgi:DNA-directed RNA polymerase specialized sigma24 family protein
MQETMLATTAFERKTATPRAARRDTVARVTTAFAELEEEHRIVLSLHYLERLSLEQIAVVLDDTEESVRVVYDEAVARLANKKNGRKRRRRKAA